MATPFPFVANTVLTAAQLNAITELPSATKTANYTLVAADAGTRVVMNVASANTVTVDNSLFSAGQIVQISNIGAGVTTVTAGAGVTINSADVLTLAQYQGGSLVFSSASAAVWFPTAKTVTGPGLVFITGAAFTAVANVSFANNTFSSTYRNYLVLLQITAVGGSQNIIARLRKTGTDATTAYFNMMDGINSNGGDNNITSNSTGEWFVGRMLGAGANMANATITLFAPQVNQKTGATIVMQGEDTSVGATGHAGGLFHNTADQYDSMTILGGSAQTITGTYRVYGYADS